MKSKERIMLAEEMLQKDIINTLEEYLEMLKGSHIDQIEDAIEILKDRRLWRIKGELEQRVKK